MQSILTFEPMIAHSRNIPPNLMDLIEAKKVRSEIVLALNYTTDDQFQSDVQHLIQTGYPITKDHIGVLCNAQNVDFDEFRKTIDDNVMQASLVTPEMCSYICTNYNERTASRISDTFIRLAIAYWNVRSHINRLDVPYFDYDGNVLKNAQKLLAEVRVAPSPDQKYVQPYRPRNSYVSNIVDMFFGDCAFCDHYDRFNAFEYDGYGSYDENGEDDDQHSSDEIEQESEAESAEPSDQEYEMEDVQGEPCSDENVSDTDGDEIPSNSDDNPADSDESASDGSIDGVIKKKRRVS